MDYRAELYADNAWEAEDDKTSFFNVGFNCFDQLHLKERPISFPIVHIRTKTQKYDK